MKAQTGLAHNGQPDLKPVILIIDDHYHSFQSLPQWIDIAEYQTIWAPESSTGLDYLERLGSWVYLVILDLKTADLGGAALLQQVRQLAPEAAVLMTSPLGPFLYANGTFFDIPDLNLKNSITGVLTPLLENLDPNSAKRRMSAENTPLMRSSFDGIIGKSPIMNQVYHLIDRLKNTDITVLIQGESGSGKELVARNLHRHGNRSSRPFVAINCGAIPSALMESELFGHERGAFTSAVQQHKGKFETAHGGTLFLDEIGELDPDLQVKLLRALQEREIQRIGGNCTLHVDVRVIAATSRDLRAAVENGQFRKDLFYRLSVVPIRVPPLRDRCEDIPLLLDHFIRQEADKLGRQPPTMAQSVLQALTRYDYPGNVRELINIVQRMLVLGQEGEVQLSDLPSEIRNPYAEPSEMNDFLKPLPHQGVRLRDMEKELILKTLTLTQGNKQAAAGILGITRRLLYLRLAEYGQVQTV